MFNTPNHNVKPQPQPRAALYKNFYRHHPHYYSYTLPPVKSALTKLNLAPMRPDSALRGFHTRWFDTLRERAAMESEPLTHAAKAVTAGDASISSGRGGFDKRALLP